MKNNKNIIFLEKIILITTAIISAALTILPKSFLERLFGQIIDYAWLSSVLLLLLIVHIIISIFKSEGNSFDLSNIIENNKTDIIQSIRGVEKRYFGTINEVDEYVAKRIKEAKISVKDLNWQDFRTSPTNHTHNNRQITDDEIDESIKLFCKRRRDKKLKSKSEYVEIFTFPDTNKKNLQKMKNHVKNGDIYSCSFYDTIKELKFPKLQFVIIDNIEVVFVSSEYVGNFCAIKDRNIVNICSNYFMQAWKLSTIIKEKNKNPIYKQIEEIENKYNN